MNIHCISFGFYELKIVFRGVSSFIHVGKILKRYKKLNMHVICHRSHTQLVSKICQDLLLIKIKFIAFDRYHHQHHYHLDYHYLQ